MQKNKKGFTLVELSIVLVIIGLLIGGILAAQSMIGTAKIQGVVRQLSQYDVAVTNFQTKYNQLPGDSNLFPSGAVNGNNNGDIEYGEIFLPWYQLSLGVGLQNYLGSNYPYMPTPYSRASCPEFDIDQDKHNLPCLLMYDGSPGQGTAILDSAKNYYSYDAPLNSSIGNGNTYDVLRAKDVLAIDQKIDDGLPLSGKVLSQKESYGGSAICVSNSAYAASDTGYGCTMHVQIGAISGTAN